MECPSCGAGVREGVRFCTTCGASLAERVCGECGRHLAAVDQFCGGCGAHFGPEVPPAPRTYAPPAHLADKILHSRGAIEGERKQVTVLFADVRGSMDLQAGMDPETWHGIMEGCVRVLAEGVHRYEGTVNQFTGDGIMALFGAPIAHEDHAQRACYAALQLRDDVRRYADEVRREHGVSLGVRVGLNSGEVVVAAIGDDLHMDYTAIGHTVGLAQRMETMADPGTVFLTEHTAGIVSGFFAMRDLGPMPVKGLQGNLGVQELQGVGAARSRLDVARARGFSKFVGREGEMRTLHDALERARSGDGQVVGVVALAGTGKSRLCYEFTQQCSAQEIPVYEAHGVAHGKAVPLLPMLEFMRGFFGIAEQDTDQQARQKVAGTLVLIDKAFDDVLPVLFEFLGIPDPQRPVPQGMDPEAKQRQLFGMMQHLMRQAAGPSVLLFEDLHWFDPASATFLEKLVEGVQDTHVLVLASFRPEFAADWMRQSLYQQIPLPPLGTEAVTHLLDDLLGRNDSLNGVPDLVRDRTGGNPFFIEEAIQALAEEGSLAGARGAYTLTRPIQELTIPQTVQAVLAARIDRLAERDKEVLQTAAVIGRTFTDGLIHAVAPAPAADLDAALRALVSAELLYETALYPETEYTFKHALTQEVAYHSQLTDRRRRIHSAVAQAIETLYPDDLDERAAVLAHHHEGGGDNLAAAQWHRRAARWIRRSDLAVALGHWRRVRAVLESVADSNEKNALGLDARVQILRAAAEVGLDGVEAEEVFTEGKALAESVGSLPALARLHAAYGHACGMRANLAAHVEHSAQAVRIADQLGDHGTQALALWVAANSLLWAGRLTDALTSIERGYELTVGDPAVGRRLIASSAAIDYTWIRGRVWMYMGRLAEAEREVARALDLAHARGQASLVHTCHALVAEIAVYAGDEEQADTHCRRMLEMVEEVNVVRARAWSYRVLGHVHWAAGDWAAAASALERYLEMGRSIQTTRHQESESLGWLARAYLGLGKVDAARRTAEEALALALERGAKLGECEARLSVAQVLLHADGAAAAEDIAATLNGTLELIAETGAAVMEPLVRIELAELARVTGDPETRERELREAQRLFTAIGAPIRAQQVAELLEKS